MRTAAVISFDLEGQGSCLYTETIDLYALGRLSCKRATFIEFNSESQEWEVRNADDGLLMYSHPGRGRCLEWERMNLPQEP